MGFKKAADGVTKSGKTKGTNLGDSGPTVGIESGAKGGKGKGGKTKTYSGANFLARLEFSECNKEQDDENKEKQRMNCS